MKLDNYIIDLFIAFTEIDHRYFDNRALRPNNDAQYEQKMENAITAELYHRFRNRMEDRENSRHYINKILHFDINKIDIGRADIILHNSQTTRLNHILFIEAKMSLTNNDSNDLKNKIEIAISNSDDNPYHLNYKHGVIMLYSEDQFEEKTENFLNLFENENLRNKITFIGRDTNGCYLLKKK
ncbi:MAG: hypothetical protein KFKLKKLM_00335 [Flavobacteriales bacterium]|nr:hypothetical protein [Flavobacteriales bacterium]